MAMSHEVPGEFNNETKWLRYFGNKQFIMLGIGGAVTYLDYKIFSFFGNPLLGVALGIIVTIIFVAPSMIPVPETEFINGGGITYDVKLLRVLIRKNNRAIYVRGWGKNELEES